VKDASTYAQRYLKGPPSVRRLTDIIRDAQTDALQVGATIGQSKLLKMALEANRRIERLLPVSRDGNTEN
jgi:hypothetical protein